MQSLGEVDSSRPERWHPKLTPYRLLVLGVTIGVGTAKAVVVQKGAESASITLEWVSGVVLFLILNSMSNYDEVPKDPPVCLGWMFTIDCMDYVWRLLSLVRIPRPSYSSQPEPTPRSDISAHDQDRTSSITPLTLYRLLLCVATAVFGLTKAVMTYSGQSAGANWVDWTLAVVLTSILFVLGMYENNTIGMWHAFFVVDYAADVKHVMSLTYVCLFHLIWLWFCVFYIRLTWAEPDNSDSAQVPSTPARLAILSELLTKTCISLSFALLFTAVAISSVLSVAKISADSKLPWWVDRGEWVMRQRPVWKNGYMRLQPPQGRRLSTKVAYHIVSLTIFLLGCAVFLALWVVCVAANIWQVYTFLYGNSASKSEFQPNWGFFGMFVLVQMICAIATAYLMWLVTWRVLLPPLWKWRNPERERQRVIPGLPELGWEDALLF